MPSTHSSLVGVDNEKVLVVAKVPAYNQALRERQWGKGIDQCCVLPVRQVLFDEAGVSLHTAQLDVVVRILRESNKHSKGKKGEALVLKQHLRREECRW